ncbi:MAG: hypothetical protein D6766_13625, partial [Verrucomicrobia bacterium]
MNGNDMNGNEGRTMNDLQDPRAVKAANVLRLFQERHPNTAALVKPVASDPTHLRKPTQRIDQWRIRLLPVTRRPRTFWSNNWGFYEITVGSILNGGALGSVWFCHFPNQKATGSGHYVDGIRDVLDQAAARRPELYYHKPDGSPPCFLFGVRYPISKGEYPV